MANGYKIPSRDGVDSDGVRAEVLVNVGELQIDSIDRKEKALNVTFKAPNHLIKYPFHGWLPKTETKAVEMVEEAFTKGSPITFRIETQRKNGEDRKKPLADVESSSKTAKLVEVNGLFTSEALTDPEEDEKFKRGTKFANQGVSAIKQRERQQMKPTRQVGSKAAEAKIWRAMVGSFGEFLSQAKKMGINVGDSEEGKNNRKFVVSISSDYMDVIDAIIARTHQDMSGGGSDYSIGTRALAYSLMESVLPVNEEILFNKEERRNWKNSLFKMLGESVIAYDMAAAGELDVFDTLEESDTIIEQDLRNQTQIDVNDYPFLIKLYTEFNPEEISELSGDKESEMVKELCELSGVEPQKLTSLIRATYGVTKIKDIPKEEIIRFVNAYSGNYEAFRQAVNETHEQWEENR